MLGCLFLLPVLANIALAKTTIVAINNGSEHVLYDLEPDGTLEDFRNLSDDIDDAHASAMGDMNGDGYIDIVVGIEGQKNKVYFGQADGSFGDAIEFGQEGNDDHDTRSIALGDLDGDGDLDIVSAEKAGGDRNGNDKIYENQCTSDSFYFRFAGQLVHNNHTRAVALGDMDNDGDLDIVTTGYNEGHILDQDYHRITHVWWNSGSLSLDYNKSNSYTLNFTGRTITTSLTQCGYSLALGDLNGDGALDILQGNRTECITDAQHINGGNSIFKNSFVSDPGIDDPFPRTGMPCCGGDTYAVAIEDMNGDGDLDIIVADFDARDRIFLKSGSKNKFEFSQSIITEFGDSQTHSFALADVDADGDMDIASGTKGDAPPNRVYLRDGYDSVDSRILHFDFEELKSASSDVETKSIHIFYGRDVTINVEDLPVPLHYNLDPRPQADTFYISSATPFVSAPHLIEDTNCYYRLKSWQKEGGEEQIVEFIDENAVQEIDARDGITITWRYEKVYRLEVSADPYPAPDPVNDPDAFPEPKECAWDNNSPGITPGTCIAYDTCASGSTESCALPSDVHYYPEHTSLILTSKNNLVYGDDTETPCGGLLTLSGNTPAPTDQIQGDRMWAQLFLTRNTSLAWSYADTEIMDVGAEVVPPPRCTMDGSVNFNEDIEIELIRKDQEWAEVGPSFDGEEAPTNSSFHWNSVTKVLSLNRPLPLFEVTWPAGQCTCTEDDCNIQRYSGSWPTDSQKHIVNAPANLNEGREEYGFIDILYSEQPTVQTTAASDGVFQPDQEGNFVLRFSSGDETQLMVVESVTVTTWESLEGNEKITKHWPVGTPITATEHFDPTSDPKKKNGYVYDENAPYDGNGPFRAYDRASRTGEIIPVNSTEELMVVWYQTDTVQGIEGTSLGIAWPAMPVHYNCQWPDDLLPKQWPVDVLYYVVDIIDIGDGNGSGPLEGAQASGMVYNQPDPDAPGFNPNEEHALMVGETLYALRNDLNNVENLSDPYVLLKYQVEVKGEQQWRMRVFKVTHDTDFAYDLIAGSPILPPMPLGLLPAEDDSHVKTGEDFHFEDHKGDHWAKAGDGTVAMYWYYPLLDGFYYPQSFVYPQGHPDEGESVAIGDPIPLLNGGKAHGDFPKEVTYTVSWPGDAPELYVGETLMTAKYGLPAVGSMASAQVIFDQGLYRGNRPLVKLYAPLATRKVDLSLSDLPDVEKELVEGSYRFPELQYSLKCRLLYDPVNQQLLFKGLLFNEGLGEPLLLSNVMTEKEKEILLAFGDTSGWDSAVKELLTLSRNPNLIGDDDRFWSDLTSNNEEDNPDAIIDNWGIELGLELTENDKKCYITETYRMAGTIQHKYDCVPHISPLKITGEQMALTAGMAQDTGWVVVAENNDESLGAAPVALHLLRVGNGPYRGELKVIKSDNVFDEKLTLRHTGDFGGEPEQVYFTWYYKPDENGIPPRFPDVDPPTGWTAMEDGEGWGKLDITIEGTSPLTLSDNWIMARYYYGHAYPQLRGKAEVIPDAEPVFTATADDWSDWAGGPGNQNAQLAEGWIKRVFDDLNPLEARVTDFRHNETNTMVSMVSQLGERYEGAIALNSSPENLNSIGLISAYETILDRGSDFSIDNGTNYGPVNNALLNAATRLAGFYTLLGNDAYADAVDPTIGFDTQAGEFGSMMPTIFAFQNQLDSLLDEELILLRGRDDDMATTRANPVYNRLIWNFTRDIGEVAYTTCYNVSDMDNSGVINEYDAQDMFPQGHGDAWGHYLSAMNYWYGLLTHDHFTWEPRMEAVMVGGAPVPVDYLDERKFAQTAAVKAKIGAEIVNMTYRKHYVDDPAGQWQGYKDTDEQRAWGVDGWARRAGQGTYFDWVVANGLLPDVDPNPEHEGISKIDRTTVPELQTIAAEYTTIQTRMDEADNGLNPAGLAKGVVPFDIDPSLIDSGQTHFEQIHERAVKALNNAGTVFEHANNYTRMLRENEESLDDFRNSLEDQERDYLNRLIEVFGYPYAGDIGSGGFYPDGYEGPDWLHFMYVDVPELSGIVTDANEAQINKYTVEWMFDDSYSTTFDPSDSVFDIDLGIPSVDDQGNSVDMVVKKVTFTFREGDIWFAKDTLLDGIDVGQRRAPGEIQSAISDMIQAQIAYNKALDEYNFALEDITRAKDILELKFDVVDDQIYIRHVTNDFVSAANVSIGVLDGIKAIFCSFSNMSNRTADATMEALPKNWSDAFSAGRGTILTVAVLANIGIDGIIAGIEAAELSIEQGKEWLLRKQEYDLFKQDARYEVQQLIHEMEIAYNAAVSKKYDMMMHLEILHQSQGRYQAAVAKGERLLSERASSRARAAADVQEYRYQDLGFRVFRNDALQKYRASFDLASRYVYLAATAYDYETNLLGSDYGAGRKFLTDIVRQRALGELSEGFPVAGRQGLADPLARLDQNFAVYKTQLGFNNPQTETNRFSLRSELFRIRSDETSASSWQKTLKSYLHDDLWQVPEFKKFCRPFAPEYMGAQPGLVIPFNTEVTFGKNYFGWPLGPGDSSYDPTNFATRVRSVGIWFTDYNTSELSYTPRIYMVPVGADVLRSPSGDGFSLREWDVVDQKLPVPFPIGASDLTDDYWIPQNDSLSGEMGAIRRFSSFRAYPDSGIFEEGETISDSRLIGRSVWNTSWVLIIPGGTLLWDQDEGLDTFINSVSDIKLFFQTYAYSGN